MERFALQAGRRNGKKGLFAQNAVSTGRGNGRMREFLMRLAALCMLAAVSEQLTGGRLRDGVRLIGGVLAAQLILEMIHALPGALFS